MFFSTICNKLTSIFGMWLPLATFSLDFPVVERTREMNHIGTTVANLSFEY